MQTMPGDVCPCYGLLGVFAGQFQGWLPAVTSRAVAGDPRGEPFFTCGSQLNTLISA
jgi:hypothetical protein